MYKLIFTLILLVGHSVLANSTLIKIKHIQPNLNQTQLKLYSRFIYFASTKYKVSEDILISLIQTESSFRNKLPEGAAGEIGMCQIRKSWLKDKSFISTFGHKKAKDLKNPAFSIAAMAWILDQYRYLDRIKPPKHKSLPFWSRYNGSHEYSRLVYSRRVYKYLKQILGASNLYYIATNP